MKIEYKHGDRAPFLLSLSTDELLVIRYNLGQALEQFGKKIWQSAKRDFKRFEKVIKELEQHIQTLKI
jgi:hypothetical protein